MSIERSVSHQDAVDSIRNLRDLLVYAIRRGELANATRKTHQLFPLIGIMLGMSVGRPEMSIVKEAVEEAALEIKKAAQEAGFDDIASRLNIFTRGVPED